MLFDENSLASFVDDYHGKLKELFGEENYEESINGIYFILTHNDKHKREENEIKGLINKKIVEFARLKNDGINSILSHLSDHHYTVNYDADEQMQLVNHIKSAFDEMKSYSVKTASMKGREQLTVQSNLLNQFCEQAMRTKTDELTNHHTDFSRDLDYAIDTLSTNMKEINKVQQRLKEFCDETKRLEAVNIQMNTLNTSAAADILKIKAENQEENRILGSFKAQLEFLSTECNKFDTVSLRQDISVIQRHGLFNEDTCEYKSLIGMEPCEQKNSTILVVRAEPNDATLRGYINNSDSLLPTDIESINNCTLDIVLYNSANVSAYQHASVKVSNIKVSTTDLEFSFSTPKSMPFKVLIYTAMPFGKSTAAAKLKCHLTTNLNSHSTKITSNEKVIEQQNTSIVQNKHTITCNKESLEQLAVNLLTGEQELNSQMAIFKHNCTAMQQTITQITEDVVNQGKVEEVQKIKRIGTIFRKNNLETDLLKLITDNEKLTEKIHVDLKIYSSKLAKFDSAT